MLLVERSGFGLNELLGGPRSRYDRQLCRACKAPVVCWPQCCQKLSRHSQQADATWPAWKRSKPRFRSRHMSARRTEEHTSELQSLMRISYADICMKKKN